jgi:hypothetical protein
MGLFDGRQISKDPPLLRQIPDALRDLALAQYEADLQVVRYIDRRKRGMPADLAAYATAVRDARLMAMRQIERTYHLVPYERA